MKNILIAAILLTLGLNLLAQSDSGFTEEIQTENQLYRISDSKSFQPLSKYSIIQEKSKFNGHTYDYYHGLYKKAVSTEKTGKILMIVGGPTFAAGILMGFIGFGMGWGGADNANGVLFSGLGLAVGGFIAFNVGIPFFVTGKIKKRKNKKMMEQGWPHRDPDSKILTFGATSNGIGFILQL